MTNQQLAEAVAYGLRVAFREPGVAEQTARLIGPETLTITLTQDEGALRLTAQLGWGEPGEVVFERKEAS